MSEEWKLEDVYSLDKDMIDALNNVYNLSVTSLTLDKLSVTPITVDNYFTNVYTFDNLKEKIILHS